MLEDAELNYVLLSSSNILGNKQGTGWKHTTIPFSGESVNVLDNNKIYKNSKLKMVRQIV